MPASSTSAFTFPINIGDSVLLIFSMSGIDTWKRGDGRATTPSDFRHHSVRDCVAITGVFPFSNSVNNPSKRSWPHSTQDTVMVHNIGTGTETEIRMKPSGNIIVNTKQNVEVNCNNATINAESMNVNVPTTTWVGNINQTGDIIQTGGQVVSGDVVAGGISQINHVHGGVEGGNSATAPPI